MLQLAPLAADTIALPPTVASAVISTPRPTHEGFETLIKDSNVNFETWANEQTRLGTRVMLFDYGENGQIARVNEPMRVKVRSLPDITTRPTDIQPWLVYGSEFKPRFELEIFHQDEDKNDEIWLPIYQPQRDLYELGNFQPNRLLSGFSLARDNNQRLIDTQLNREVIPQGQTPWRFYTWDN